MSVTATGLDALRTARDAGANRNDPNQIGQGDFMKLMITQFKNQDPFKPMDSTQFLGQLAQFSTVSGIQEMQGSLATLSDSLRSSQMLSGAALVGRDVLAPAETINHEAGRSLMGAVDLPEGTASAVVTVRDADTGQLVRRLELPASPGLFGFSWDGLDESGATADSGRYALEVVANVGGTRESLPVQVVDRVLSVSLDPQTHGVRVNTATLGSVALSDVRQIG